MTAGSIGEATTTLPPVPNRGPRQAPLQGPEFTHLVNGHPSVSLNRKGIWLDTKDLPEYSKIEISVLLMEAFGVSSSGDGDLDRWIYYWTAYALARLPDNIVHAGTGLPHGLTIVSPMIAEAVANSDVATRRIRNKMANRVRRAAKRQAKGLPPRRRFAEVLMQWPTGIRLANWGSRQLPRAATTPGRFVTGAASMLAVWPLAILAHPLLVPLFTHFGVTGLISTTAHLASAAAVGGFRAVVPHSPALDALFHGAIKVITFPFALVSKPLRPYFYKERHGRKSLGRREQAIVRVRHDWKQQGRSDTYDPNSLFEIERYGTESLGLGLKMLLTQPFSFARGVLFDPRVSRRLLFHKRRLFARDVAGVDHDPSLAPRHSRKLRAGHDHSARFYTRVFGATPDMVEAPEPESTRRHPGGLVGRVCDFLVGPKHLALGEAGRIWATTVGPQPASSHPLQVSWNLGLTKVIKQMRKSPTGAHPLGEDGSAAAMGATVANYLTAAAKHGVQVNLSLEAMSESTMGRYTALILDRRGEVPRFDGAPVVRADANAVAAWRLGADASMTDRNSLAVQLIKTGRWNSESELVTENGEIWQVDQSAFIGRPPGSFKERQGVRHRSASKPVVATQPVYQPARDWMPALAPAPAVHPQQSATVPDRRIAMAQDAARHPEASTNPRIVYRIAIGVDAAMTHRDPEAARYLLPHLSDWAPDAHAAVLAWAESDSGRVDAQQLLRSRFRTTEVSRDRGALQRS